VRTQAHAVFRGVVQGVNFRAQCRGHALGLGLTGWVQNLGDGSVEAVFEGDRESVEEAIAWNRTSQPRAEVSHVDVGWSPPTSEFRTFEIRH
jgi:acylphosphatase